MRYLFKYSKNVLILFLRLTLNNHSTVDSLISPLPQFNKFFHVVHMMNNPIKMEEDDCESVTEAKTMSMKKKIDVLAAMAKYQIKKEEEKKQFATVYSSPVPVPVEEPPKAKSIPIQTLKESQLGITEFVEKGPGFSAILKQRYSDFHVNEIDMDGKIVHLTNQTIPEAPEEPIDDSIFQMLSAEQWTQIEDMMSSEEKVTVEIDVTEKSKEERLNIHKALRGKFKKEIASNSEPVEGRTVMKIFKHSGSNKSRDKKPWNPPFIQFVLYKENLSTQEAVSGMARRTGIFAKNFQTSGTKDKRAITSQLVSVKHINPEKFLKDMSHDNRMMVGNITYTDKPLQLGQLKGNRFSIVLRNVIGEEALIIQKLESLKELGFINYYGSQRFGTRHVPTHHIGRKLIAGCWKEAIDLILEPPELDGKYQRDYDLTLARNEWKASGNAHRAFSKIKRSLHTIEGQLLSNLKKFGNDFVGALNTVPRNLRLTYIHAYQSFIWNTVVSKRLAEFGFQPMIGDLVYAPGDEEGGCIETNPEETSEDDNQPDDDSRRAQRNQRKVIFVDEKNIADYTIQDVVLPLPGHDITYPANQVVTGWYTQLLEADGLSESSFKQNVKSYNLGGAYRLLMSKPLDVEWEFIRYDDPMQSLIQSDRDRLNTLSSSSIPAETDGCYMALVLKFSLPPSAYATMALRELTKMDMSSSAQSALNEAGGTKRTFFSPPEEQDGISKRLKKGDVPSSSI